MAVVLLAAWGGAASARAQAAAQFSYAQTTVGGGFENPEGVAVDKSGNIYIADEENNAVKEMPAGCASSACVTTLGGVFHAPAAVAVDGNGNVYVAETVGDVFEMPANCTSAAYNAGSCATTQLGGGFEAPSGVAVDGSGNVYVVDAAHSQVFEMPPNCTSAAWSVDSCATTVMGRFLSPVGVAVDGNGNVYVADPESDAVTEMPPNCTAAAYNANSCTITTLGGGFNGPTGVAVDGNGNVYVANQDGNAVDVMPAGCASSGCITSLGSGFNAPYGVAVDSNDNVYVGNSGENSVTELARSGANLGSVAVGTASAPSVPLTFTFTGAGSIEAPVVLTVGAPNLDFADAQTGSCDTNGTGHNYGVGDTCTVNVTFTPARAGERNGGVELLNSSGAVIANAYVYGIGVGPQVAFSPATQSTLGGGFNQPGGVAIDGSGNVYVGDDQNNAVKEIPLGCASAGCVVPLGGAFYGPTGVAIDGSGNIYVADTGHNVVKEMPSNCASAACVATLGGGFGSLYGVAVDGSGSVYIADTFNYAVKEMPSGCASASCVTLLGGGFSLPTGVAVDASGNVYVADYGNNAVYEMPPGCASASCVRTLGGGFYEPSGVAVDASGNVYVSQVYAASAYEMPAGCASSSCVTPLIAGAFLGVAVDASGDVYLTNGVTNTVTELNVAIPPTLSFVSTSVGSGSSSDPQTVMLANIGNAPLSLLTPATGTNPSVSAGFVLDSATTCPEVSASGAAGTLAAGTSCALAVDFVPSAAGTPVTGALTLTDNNLNTSPSATQTVPLSGTATQLAQTITFNTIPSQTSGQTLSLAAYASASSGLQVSFASLTSTVCSVSGTTAKLLTAGQCTIQATQAGDAEYAAATPVSQSFTVISSTNFTITATPPSAKVTLGILAAFVLELKSVDGFNGDVKLSCSGGPADSTCLDFPMTVRVNGTALAISGILFPAKTAPGTYTITFTGTSGSLTNTATAQFTVPLETPTLGFAPVAGKTFGAAPFAVSAISNSTGTITYSVASGPAKISGNVVTLTGTGIVELKASLAATSTCAAATATTSFMVDAGTPTLAFAPIAGQTEDAKPFAVSASSDSTGTITYSVVGGPARINGDMVTLTGTGAVTLRASQAATGDYTAATTTTSFNVSR